LTITLSAASGQTVSIGYTTADGTASAGADYTAGGGNIVFDPGVTSRPLTIPVKSDTLDELDEMFFVNLTGPIHATIADDQSEVTVTDDDGPATAWINDVTVAEGSSGTVEAAFTVGLKAPSGQPVTLDYATGDGTATAPTDYRPATGALTFEPGETAKTVTVTVEGDALAELNETYVVNLSNPNNATIEDAHGVGTISDDDDPAPPAPPPPAPLALDTTPPGEITNVRVVNGDGSVTVTWTNPSDADFQRVSAVRIKAGAAAQNLPRYEGRGTTFTDRGLKNGLPYRYRIRTYDGAGNVSAGVVVAALPKAALFGPPGGATITAPPTLRWKAVPGATYYNVQLYRVRRGGQAQAVTATKVLSAWPKGTSYKLRRTWRFGGKTYRLAAGSYRWYVWPGLAKRSAKKYGPMVGESTFTVKAKKKRG